jgi:LysR family transcriptional regulator, low CO2-responsive transcriptional regulator
MHMHVTFRQLTVFECVARHLNFTRASEELHLTQPTVSMQIKELTSAVGAPLFEQIGRKIFLTEAGRELLMTAREIADAWDRFEMTANNLQGLQRGKLRVAIVTTAKYFVPRLLGEFSRLYPEIEVALEVANRDAVVERLTANLDDIYVMGVPPAGMSLTIEPFLDNPLVVIAPAKHPFSGKRITLAQLARERFVQREQGSGTRLAAEKFFAEHDIKLNVKLELGTNEAIIQGVAGGLGLAVLSQHAIGAHERDGEIAVLNVQGFPLKRAWYIVEPEGKKLSVVAQAFRAHLLKGRVQARVQPLVQPYASRAKKAGR